MITFMLGYLVRLVKRNFFTLFSYFIATLTIVVYLPAIYGGFLADDYGQIVNNVYVHSLAGVPHLFRGGTFYFKGASGLGGLYYRPMMMLLYSIIISIFGINPIPLHLTQIFLHLVNGYLLYSIYKFFLKEKRLALSLAAIFLVHPLNVEAVSYLADLQDILVFLLGALALLIHLRRPDSIKHLMLASILLFFSLLSKESGLVYIVLSYLIYELFYPRQLKRNREFFILISIIVVVLYIVMRCIVAKICVVTGTPPISDLSFLSRLLHIPIIMQYYFHNFIFPNKIAILQQWYIQQYDVHTLFLPLLELLVIGTVLLGFPFYLWFKKDTLLSSQSKKWFCQGMSLGRIYVFFLFWFVIGMGLYVQIFPLDAIVADRWFYIPMAGLLGMLGVVIRLFDWNRSTHFFIVVAIIVSLFAARSYVRNLDWANHTQLYKKDILISPNSPSLENNYGVALLRAGEYDEAKVHFKKAVLLNPTNPIFLSNLGELAEVEGNEELALEYYERAVIVGKWPFAFERYYHLLIKQGRLNEAELFRREKLEVNFPYLLSE